MRAGVILAAACLAAACSQTPQRKAPAAAVADLAPTGTLRAAINVGNAVLAAHPTPPSDEPSGISVDLARLEVHRNGQVIPLTPREGDILEYLIRHRDRVVTRDDLLLDVWHYKSANVETRTVDIHIVGLRRKVEPDPAKPTLIQTVRGKGYRWYA